MGTLNSDKLLARKKKGKGFPLGGVEGKGLLLRTVRERERAHQRARNRVKEREKQSSVGLQSMEELSSALQQDH